MAETDLVTVELVPDVAPYEDAIWSLLEIADEEFHHPEICIRYGEVEVRLTSHEQGGITDRDLDLAEFFDDVR